MFGTAAYGASAVPPAGLTTPAKPEAPPPDKQQSLGPKRREKEHWGETFLWIERLSRPSMAYDGPTKTMVT